MRGTAGAAIIGLIVASLAPLAASAQTPEIERLLHHGVELRQRGDDAAALLEFQHAHQLANTPRTLAQVALAEQALGHWVDAEAHLREALRATDDASINRNRPALEGALGVVAQHVGELMVRCDVDGAELVVGGRGAGTLPLAAPLRVEAAEIEVRARANGREASQRVQVNAGDTALVLLRLGSAPVVVPAPAVASVAAIVQVPAMLRGPAVATSPAAAPAPTGFAANTSVSRPGSTQRALGWLSLVGGAIGLGVGVAGIFIRDDGARAYNDNVLPNSRDSRCPGSSVAYGLQPLDCAGWLDQEYNGGIMRLAGLIGGGALTLTGIIVLATAPSSASQSSARVSCGPGPGQAGVTCGGSF